MSTETIEVNVGDAVSRGADATAKADSGKMALNVGPSHPTTHGVLRLMMDLDGDVITRCEPVLGYLHRGDEKNCGEYDLQSIRPLHGSVGLSFSVGQQCRLRNRG